MSILSNIWANIMPMIDKQIGLSRIFEIWHRYFLKLFQGSVIVKHLLTISDFDLNLFFYSAFRFLLLLIQWYGKRFNWIISYTYTFSLGDECGDAVPILGQRQPATHRSSLQSTSLVDHFKNFNWNVFHCVHSHYVFVFKGGGERGAQRMQKPWNVGLQNSS